MAVSRGRDHQLHYQEVITLIIFISFLLQALRPAPAAWWSEQVWGRWRLGMGRDYRCEEIAWSEIIIDVISVIISLVSRYSRHDCTGPVSAASWSPPRLAPQFHPISNLNLYLLPAQSDGSAGLGCVMCDTNTNVFSRCKQMFLKQSGFLLHIRFLLLIWSFMIMIPPASDHFSLHFIVC